MQTEAGHSETLVTETSLSSHLGEIEEKMAFIQMSVPLVFWGQRPPAHEITCICRTEEKKGVATASRTGQVVLWDILRERGTEKIKVREGERGDGRREY